MRRHQQHPASNRTENRCVSVLSGQVHAVESSCGLFLCSLSCVHPVTRVKLMQANTSVLHTGLFNRLNLKPHFKSTWLPCFVLYLPLLDKDRK